MKDPGVAAIRAPMPLVDAGGEVLSPLPLREGPGEGGSIDSHNHRRPGITMSGRCMRLPASCLIQIRYLVAAADTSDSADGSEIL